MKFRKVHKLAYGVNELNQDSEQNLGREMRELSWKARNDDWGKWKFWKEGSRESELSERGKRVETNSGESQITSRGVMLQKKKISCSKHLSHKNLNTCTNT